MNGGRALVSPKRVTLILCLVVLFLIIAGIVSIFVIDSRCHRQIKGGTEFPTVKTRYMGGQLLRLFDLDRELNIPTFYSTAALLLSSALLAIIAFVKKKEDAPYRLHWKVLSVIFLFLSLDEATSLHGKTRAIIELLLSALKSSGFLHYRLPTGMDGALWVIPAAVFILIFVLAYRRFLADLPQKTRNLFLVAGALFIGGALGMEFIGGYYKSLYLSQSVTLLGFCDLRTNYSIMVTVEENREKIGSK